MVLLYTTGDYRFADRAIEALRAAQIPCYSIPPTWSSETADHLTGETEALASNSPEDPSKGLSKRNLSELEANAETSSRTVAPEPEEPTPYRSRLAPEICVYADEESDFQRASEILLKLGAVPEPILSAATVERLNRWTTWLAIIAAVVIVLLVWENR